MACMAALQSRLAGHDGWRRRCSTDRIELGRSMGRATEQSNKQKMRRALSLLAIQLLHLHCRCPGGSRARGDASEEEDSQPQPPALLCRWSVWSTLHVNATPRPRAPASPSPSSDPAAAAPPCHCQPASQPLWCGLLGGPDFPIPSAAWRTSPSRNGTHVARQGGGGSWVGPSACLSALSWFVSRQHDPARVHGHWTIIGA